MLPLEELKKMGVPIPLLTLGFGLVAGWLTCNVLTMRQLESLRGELSLSRQQLQAAQQACSGPTDQDEKMLQQCEQSKERLAQQAEKLEQLSTWNEQWSRNYRELESNCALLMPNVMLTRQMADVRDQWESASSEVIRYTSGNCGPQVNDCDLIPLAQRKLKAMEAKRDQLQVQMLDLQSRIVCQAHR